MPCWQHMRAATHAAVLTTVSSVALGCPAAVAALSLVACASAGMTGPVEFDSKGDLVAHNGTYVKATFDTKTGQLQLGGPLPMSR